MLLKEDRINHLVDKSICTGVHEDFAFLTRCQWLLYACLQRGFVALQNFREKICRNLAHVLPNGYQSIGSISPDHYVYIV